jgi:hypothetical protein
MTRVAMSLLLKVIKTIKKISVNRKLEAETKRPQVLIYYDLVEELTYEEEDLIFETKP